MNGFAAGTVLQFTDCHVFAPQQNLFYRGVDTNASLLACLEAASQLEKPDLLVISGDLSNDETRSSYQFLADSIVQFFPETPCLIQAGNHDDRNLMQLIFPRHHCRINSIFRLGSWVVYMLDIVADESGWYYANIPDQIYDDLDALAEDDEIDHVLIFMHYNLVTIEFRGIECGVTGTDGLRQYLQTNNKVRCVSSGHVHQEYHWLEQGIIYTSTPPTGIQSKLKNGDDSQEWIGFKRFELFANGSMNLDTQRVCPPLKPNNSRL